MPHLIVQYSANLEQRADVKKFCACMAREIRDIGLFPLGGIRVRAQAQAHFAIADLHQDNAFLDMVFRIGAGRTAQQKQHTGERLLEASSAFFSKELARGYFALSLDIVELEAPFSWKINSIHQRLNDKE